MSKPRVVIVDIDGTLADCEHRRTSLPNWDKFFQKMSGDTPIQPVIDLLHMLPKTFDGVYPTMVFVSGRPNDYREQTLDWLYDNGLTWAHDDNLFMRPAGDRRPDSVVKKEILMQLRERYDPFLAIDDRSTVVSMWRENGVFCLQCPDKTLSLAPGDTTPFVPVQGECLLTLLVGPSGAGKSTYAKEHFHPASVLESDQLRAELCGDFRDQSRNAQVFSALHSVARCRLAAGLPVVIDATHLRRKDRMGAVTLAPGGSVVRYVVVDRPLQQKLEGRDWRPESLILKHHNDFASQTKDILAGDYLSNVVVVNEIKGV